MAISCGYEAKGVNEQIDRAALARLERATPKRIYEEKRWIETATKHQKPTRNGTERKTK